MILIVSRYYAKTIENMNNYNAFDDTIAALSVSGTLLLSESYQTPWAIEMPDGETLAKALGVHPKTQIVPFHFVRRGSFSLQIPGAETLVVHAGETVICVGGESHIMINGDRVDPVPFLSILEQPDALKQISMPGSTDLICGIFMLRNTMYNPLFDALPSVLHIDVSGRTGEKTVKSLAGLLADEVITQRAGQSYMCGRLLEMFCAAAIRAHIENHTHQETSWLKGLHDPKIGVALNQIHSAPQAMISVEALARNVGMSSSRFAARFREVIGMPPMSYVAQWRMNIASRLLIETDMNVDQISQKVGYESLPAFARAFRRHYDAPPAKWRKMALAI